MAVAGVRINRPARLVFYGQVHVVGGIHREGAAEQVFRHFRETAKSLSRYKYMHVNTIEIVAILFKHKCVGTFNDNGLRWQHDFVFHRCVVGIRTSIRCPGRNFQATNCESCACEWPSVLASELGNSR